jgi:hypothetical protein
VIALAATSSVTVETRCRRVRAVLRDVDAVVMAISFGVAAATCGLRSQVRLSAHSERDSFAKPAFQLVGPLPDSRERPTSPVADLLLRRPRWMGRVALRRITQRRVILGSVHG